MIILIILAVLLVIVLITILFYSFVIIPIAYFRCKAGDIYVTKSNEFDNPFADSYVKTREYHIIGKENGYIGYNYIERGFDNTTNSDFTRGPFKRSEHWFPFFLFVVDTFFKKKCKKS